jgi:hypothetical protein
MLLSKYRLARANIDGFRDQAPYGWAFPEDQWDPFALDELLDKFRLLGVEVYEADQAFSAGDRQLPAGTVVVPTSQPFGGFVKTLLERQDYPDLRTRTHLWQGIPRRIDVESGPLRPYDVAGWTLPLQMGLDAVELTVPASELALTRVMPGGPQVREEGRGVETWILDRGDGLSWKAVNLLQARGVTVEVEVGGEGRFVIRQEHATTVREVFRLLDRTPKARVILPARAQEIPETRPLAPIRVGLYRPWQSNMDEGWIRWILEHYSFPVTELRNDRIREGGLNDDFDAIILPTLRARGILEGNREGSLPQEYTGGIGDEGLGALKAFAREGGTLFFHQGSGELALTSFDLPLESVTDEARSAGFYSAGSILRFEWETRNPLTAGMNPEGVAFTSSSSLLFLITGEGRGEAGTPRVLGHFPEEGPLLLSGYLEGEEGIQGKSAAVEVPYGEGRLILVGFSLHNRAQTVANFKLLFNALVE